MEQTAMNAPLRTYRPPAADTQNHRSSATTRVAPFAHLHISSFANFPHHSSPITHNSHHSFSAKERDLETGLSYFGSRYYSADLSVWLSVDPMYGKYPSTSPYAYCRNNPIILYDPNGMCDDWIENMETGEIEWRQDVRNAEQTPDGYKYIGPTYDLPNGAGRLGNVNFNTYGGDIQELPFDNSQSAMVCISVDFMPAVDDGDTYKWVQTYWTNAFLDSGSETNCDEVANCFDDYVDCGGQTDPSKSCYFTQTNMLNAGGINLQDCHRRFPCSNKSIDMFCTSSVVNASKNNNPVATIYWGYHISEEGIATFSLQICPTIDNQFHKIAIQNAQ